MPLSLDHVLRHPLISCSLLVSSAFTSFSAWMVSSVPMNMNGVLQALVEVESESAAPAHWILRTHGPPKRVCLACLLQIQVKTRSSPLYT